MSIQELEGSELGTKEYWENAYSTEIQNYKNHGDPGEVWFDEDSQVRIVNWIMKQNIDPENTSIVDLGCGNGMFLIELARETKFKKLLGLDYSPNAVELAASIAKDQALDISYQVADLTNVEATTKLGKFGIIHDKGTYDAISLCPENPQKMRELYIECVNSLMDERSLFIITSCNWTEDELVLSFANKFTKKCSIPTPTFKFGGKIGNVVTSVVFSRNIST